MPLYIAEHRLNQSPAYLSLRLFKLEAVANQLHGPVAIGEYNLQMGTRDPCIGPDSLAGRSWPQHAMELRRELRETKDIPVRDILKGADTWR